jgi:carboxyl-terminal processing protease
MGAPHASRSIVFLLLLVLAPSIGCDAPGSDVPSRFPPASTVANRCDDPAATWQWVRSTVDELYLWADDVVDADPSASASPAAYFRALLVRTPTASGHPRDRFSEAYPTALFQAGLPVWHGVRWALHGTDARALYVRDQTPAAAAGVRRGDRVVAVGGMPVETLGAAALSAALSPPPGSGSVELTLADPGGATRTVDLGLVTFFDPGVLFTTVLDRPQGKVGYVAFTSQLGDPVGDTTAAVRRFLAAGVTDLVLDVRYNPGGIAPVVAAFGTLIAGDRVGSGAFAVFTPNPSTQRARRAAGQPAEDVVYFPDAAGSPTLSLSRVFVLTTEATCSAAESLINGLRPYMTVVQVGTTTCGKPYGLDQPENCGTTYVLIAALESNSLHQADFADGLLPDCAAVDDLTHALGDPAEGMLAAALALRETRTCPPMLAAPVQASPARQP